MIRVKVSSRELRVLDLDIETRPSGFYQAGRFKPIGSEPIVISMCWAGTDKVESWTLGPLPVMSSDPEAQLEQRKLDGLSWFAARYNEADVVTGHYIGKFDLPILNGALFRAGLPLLGPKTICDTKLHLRSFAAFSQSQENLGAMLACERAKHHMCDEDWRAAGNLYPAATANCVERCEDDVLQHNELRLGLVERGALKPMRTWTP